MCIKPIGMYGYVVVCRVGGFIATKSETLRSPDQTKKTQQSNHDDDKRTDDGSLGIHIS